MAEQQRGTSRANPSRSRRSAVGRPEQGPRGSRVHGRRPESVPEERGPRSGITRMFVTAVPGLGQLVASSLRAVGGANVQEVGFDGRSDIVVFEVDRRAKSVALDLTTAEDIFVEVGRTLRAGGDNPRWIAQRIWKPARVERALSLWANEVRPLTAAMTFRVIARVLSERAFLRTELRDQLSRVITQEKVKWRFGDPAQMEVWIVEYQQGKLVTGLRLSDAGMRQHDGREVERQGALRPTVAAAMIELAGARRGLLLDPCCGSGTILAEAVRAGWEEVAGSDIDPQAVEIAGVNVTAAKIAEGDARQIGLPDRSVAACVSNLPFGQQFEVQGSMDEWLRVVLKEMARVTVVDGRVVLLAPNLPRHVVPVGLRLIERHVIRLLGTRTSLWCFEKKSERSS